MVLKREHALKTVLDGLSILRSACEDRGKLGLFDLHVLAESFFCPFLNEAHGLDLQVLKTGHPAVDLGDAQKGKAFQITADGSKAKIQHTLDTYAANKLFSTYPSLKILIIGKRRNTYAVRIPKGVAFDQATDILDTQALGAQITKLDTAQIRRLADIISAEVVITDVDTKAQTSSDILEVSLNGQIIELQDTTCTFAPEAGWGLDLVFHNTSGEVLEAGDFSIGFALPRRLYIKDDWHVTTPVYKHPIFLNESEVLYELTQFNRMLPGARARYSVPVNVDEDDPVATGDSVAITVHVHTKYGKTEYPVKLSAVTSEENLAAIQRSGKSAPPIQAAILLMQSFIQTLEGGDTQTLPSVSWKRTFAPIDPECANLSKKDMIRRLFSTSDHAKLVIYLGAVKGMYAKLIRRPDVQAKYATVCQAFGVSYDELI